MKENSKESKSLRIKSAIAALSIVLLFLLFRPRESLKIASSVPIVEDQLSTLIVIPTLTTQVQYHYRKAIRSTWKKTLPSSMKLMFFIGQAGLSRQDRNALYLESSQNEDMVLLDFKEEYNQLSYKMIEIYKYIANNPDQFKGIKWIFKTDTDVWINSIKLETLLSEYEPKRIVIGKAYKNTPVLRDGPWANKEYSSSHYPTYMAGAGYIMSFDIMAWLVHQDDNGWLKYMNNEDALLGIWLAGLNVDLIDNDNFHPNIFAHNRKFRRPIPKYCNNEAILIHNLSRRGVLITFETFSKCNSPCLDDCPADIQEELSKYLSGPEMFSKLMHDKLNIDL